VKLHKGASAIAGALPNAEHRLLAGVSHKVKMDALAPVLREFFGQDVRGVVVPIHSAPPLDVVVGWMDAMRRGDLDDVTRWLDPGVTWRGVRDAAICRDRDEVIEMLQGSLEGQLGADAVELIAGDGTVMLGAKVPGLAEIGGVDVRGQIFNVFRVGCGRIMAVEDYAHREEALAAAGVRAPQWA
jgi:limonene-1,2-epoxide hydrolase